MKLTDLIEGIVSRTSQHDKRTNAAIGVIANEISDWSSLVAHRRLDNFTDVFASLAAFIEGGSKIEELDWYFERSFMELKVKPKNRDSFKNAWVYLANRYNYIESKDEESVQEWYYDIIDRIQKEAGLQDHNDGIPE